jgi:hypothetical protein
MNLLFVGGGFDDQGQFAIPHRWLFNDFMHSFDRDLDRITYYNGGTPDELDLILANYEHRHYDIIFWLTHIKVEEVKEHFPRSILVTYTQNCNDRYSALHLVAKCLQQRANLLLEYCGERGFTRVLDPLGNEFRLSDDVHDTEEVLALRINQLLKVTRIPSRSFDAYDIEPPHQTEFLDFVAENSALFQEMIVGGNRFLGNLSFRCLSGFPSYRGKGMIFVSKRDVDKRIIKNEDFVAVESHVMTSGINEDQFIEYHGIRKPSVDTPIHLALYDYYKNVNYIMHAHVYVEAAPFTEAVLPCGALEEVAEIKRLFPIDSCSCNFAVNLRGHGSIILGDTVDALRSFQYKPRKIPELQYL